jgi:hypothetical protein
MRSYISVISGVCLVILAGCGEAGSGSPAGPGADSDTVQVDPMDQFKDKYSYSNIYIAPKVSSDSYYFYADGDTKWHRRYEKKNGEVTDQIFGCQENLNPAEGEPRLTYFIQHKKPNGEGYLDNAKIEVFSSSEIKENINMRDVFYYRKYFKVRLSGKVEKYDFSKPINFTECLFEAGHRQEHHYSGSANYWGGNLFCVGENRGLSFALQFSCDFVKK